MLFPLTLALSLGESEQPSRVFLKSALYLAAAPGLFES